MAKKPGLEEKLASADLPATATPAVSSRATVRASDTDRALTTPLPTEEESRLRKLHLENEKLRFENQKVSSDAQRLKIEIILRVVMAFALFLVVAGYIIWVLILLGGQTSETRLSDTVLGMLLGTTSVNVIGLLLTVARYLFPTTGKPTPPES